MEEIKLELGAMANVFKLTEKSRHPRQRPDVESGLHVTSVMVL